MRLFLNQDQNFGKNTQPHDGFLFQMKTTEPVNLALKCIVAPIAILPHPRTPYNERNSEALEHRWAWAWATHGILIYILYAKPGDHAQFRKRTKRGPANPVLCMCWALIVMCIRKQTRVQTGRHARSYGSDMPSVPMGTDRNSRLHTACPAPQSLPCSKQSIALLGRVFFHKFVLDFAGVQIKPHSRRARKYQNHV